MAYRPKNLTPALTKFLPEKIVSLSREDDAGIVLIAERFRRALARVGSGYRVSLKMAAIGALDSNATILTPAQADRICKAIHKKSQDIFDQLRKITRRGSIRRKRR